MSGMVGHYEFSLGRNKRHREEKEGKERGGEQLNEEKKNFFGARGERCEPDCVTMRGLNENG